MYIISVQLVPGKSFTKKRYLSEKKNVEYYELNLFILIFQQGTIEAHCRRYNADVTNDLIDAYLHEMEARKHLGSSNFNCKFLTLTFLDVTYAYIYTV